MLSAGCEKEKIQNSCYTFLWSWSVQAWLGRMNESFFKARSNRGETLLSLHQETNPGAASFSMDGRLNLRRGQHITKMIFGDMDTLCSITVSSTWKYRTFESRSSSFWVHRCTIHCHWYSFRLCQIRKFLVSSLGSEMSSSVYGLNCLTSKEPHAISLATHRFSWNHTR